MNKPAYESADSVVDAVLSASRVLVAVAARSLSDIAEEVTLTQYRTLVVLASRGPQNLVGLAEAVGVTPATATRMCDRLVKKKLIVRQSEQDDRARSASRCRRRVSSWSVPSRIDAVERSKRSSGRSLPRSRPFSCRP